MRRAARTDGNHAEIVRALRATGASVLDLSRVGDGCPDLLVGRPGANTLLEVKIATGELTEDQQRFHADWRGPIRIVRTIEEAIRAVSLRP